MVEGKGGAEPVCSGERWSANRPWGISMVVVVKVRVKFKKIVNNFRLSLEKVA